ncbi:MAG: Rieske [2Fe-2S] protein [Conexibacter sp.]|nr:Rieske [2Fe-2S] protein [Conexibacter sp.]
MLTDDAQTDAARNGQYSRLNTVSELLDLLVETANKPLEEARALPPEFYTNPEIYQLELERIWRKSWIHVGRVEELQNPGDWIAREIAGEPIVVIKGQDDEIRALSRVCRHRFMDLLDGEQGRRCGHAEKLTCPYHLWTYELDGRLTSAPYMNRSRLFEEEKDGYALPQFRVETWQGFVFVNLDPDAAALTDTFGPEVEAALGNYDATDWRLMDRIAWGETEANWKLVVDNGREAYHHIGTHGKTLEPMWPAHMIQFEPSPRNEFFMARMFISKEFATGQEDGHLISPMLMPPAPGLTPFEQSNTGVLGLYPGFIYVTGPDMLITLSFQPTGHTSHNLDIEFLFHKDYADTPEAKVAIEEGKRWLSAVQAEDSGAMRGVQRMFSSGLSHEGGALSHLEIALMTFQRYLAKRLVGEHTVSGPVIESATAGA